MSFLLVVMFTLMPLICASKTYDLQDKDDTERIPAEISITLKAGKYDIKKGAYKSLNIEHKGSYVDMEGFFSSDAPGDPMLPTRIYEIAVPPNIDWKTLKLSVDLGKVVTLPSAYDILPARALFTRMDKEDIVFWGAGKDIVSGRNMNVYGKDQFFPEKPVRIVSHSQLRKWRFVKLEFSPVQYNPVKSSLRIIQSVNVRLSFMRIGKKVYRADPLLADKLADEKAKSRFINFKEANEWYRFIPVQNTPAAPNKTDYVIITTNTIRDNSNVLNDFVANKTALGHSVMVVAENDYSALTGQTPDGTAEKIRQWLIDNYVALGIQYVLLIGNPNPSVGDVPMKMMWPDRIAYGNWECPTDYFYADLTGNWDLDGDGFFGESILHTNEKSPDPAIAPDTFSVRWTGKIDAQTVGRYNFITLSDNGIRLIINGITVIDNWTSHELTKDSGSIDLTAGQHDIQVDYYNDVDDGVVGLYWRPPGVSSYQAVPSNRLYHLEGGSYLSGGLRGEYFNNPDFTGYVLTRVDSSIQFFWGTGDLGPGGVDFANEVDVGRIPVYDNDYIALDTILQKIIAYESEVPPAWRHSLLQAYVDVDLGPGVSSNYRLGEALKTDFADPLGFTTYRAYESSVAINPPPECPAINPSDASPTAPCNMLGEWANGGGYGLVNWESHGWSNEALGVTSSINIMDSGDNVHLDDTTPAFTFQLSCDTGHPEFSHNLGYALLKQGAIGTVSPSRISQSSIFTPPWDPSPQSCGGQNLSYYYISRIMQGHAAGPALFLAKSRCNSGLWANLMGFNLYGDPSTALYQTTPGLVLLFDTSGSMSWSHEGVPGVPPEKQRLSLAKEAVYPFMQLLNDHANNRVNFGISVFPPHPWNWLVGCNGQVVAPMEQVNDTSTNTAITATIPRLVAEGNTPVLAGLSNAAATFGDEMPRAIVLLSDGYHNCPHSVSSDDPTVTSLINNLKTSPTRVYTIGFGRPTDVDHPLLARLAVETGGEFYDVTTAAFDPDTWSPATELKATYKAILVSALGLETALDPTGVINAGQQLSRKVMINQYDRKVSFFLSWESPIQNRLDFEVRTSDGLKVPLSMSDAGVSFHQGKTYKVLTVDRTFLRRPGKVGSTPWTLDIRPIGLSQGERENFQYSVIMDSALKMETSFDSESYHVGDTMVVMSKMSAGGRPILGLTDVSVKVTRAEEGLNNWLSSYKVSAKELEKIPGIRQDETLSRLTRKALYLTDIKKIVFPGRTSPSTFRMYDDGSRGDAAANDGIYTARITDTSQEGTFSFHIRASGPISKGCFEREQMIQKYVVLNTSSLKVLIGIIKIPHVHDVNRYRIVMTPKDTFDNFLGPGYARSIKVSATQGNILRGIEDHLDGTYSFLIDLPAKVDMKKVFITGSVKGTKISFNLDDELRRTSSQK